MAKKSTAASGHRTNLANAKQLITILEGAPEYQPTDSDMTPLEYKAKITSSRIATNAIEPLLYTYRDAEAQRSVVFENAEATEQPSYDYFISLKGLTDFEKQEGKHWHSKFNGSRIGDAPVIAEGEENTTSHSVSQQQFSYKIEFFRNLINVYIQCGKYVTTNPKISLAALEVVIDDMIAKNGAVAQHFLPWENKMQERDVLMYEKETGLIDTGIKIKAFCASIWLRNSEFYKKINSITLRNFKRRGTHI